MPDYGGSMGWSDVMSGAYAPVPGYQDSGVNPDMGNPFGQAMQMQPNPQQVPDPGLQAMPDFGGTGSGDWGSMVQDSQGGNGGFSFSKFIMGAMSGLGGMPDAAFQGGFKAATDAFDKARAQAIQDQQLEQQRQMNEANMAHVLANTAYLKAQADKMDEQTKQLNSVGEMTSLGNFLDKTKGSVFDMIPIHDQAAIQQHMDDLKAQGNSLTTNGVNGQTRTYIPFGDYMVGVEFNPNKIVEYNGFTGPASLIRQSMVGDQRVTTELMMQKRQTDLAYLRNSLNMTEDEARIRLEAFYKNGMDPQGNQLPWYGQVPPAQEQQNAIRAFQANNAQYNEQANTALRALKQFGAVNALGQPTGQPIPGYEQQFQAAMTDYQTAIAASQKSQLLMNYGQQQFFRGQAANNPVSAGSQYQMSMIGQRVPLPDGSGTAVLTRFDNGAPKFDPTSFQPNQQFNAPQVGGDMGSYLGVNPSNPTAGQ